MLTLTQRAASRVSHLPILNQFSPSLSHCPSSEVLAGFRLAQKTARKAVKEIESLLQEGWTEKQAATLLDTCLQDMGVKSFFHRSFVWYGERTRFDAINHPAQFSPSDRVLLPNEVYILDVAPIVQGYACDIGYTGSLAPHCELKKAKQCLKAIRDEIPKLFLETRSGRLVFESVENRLREAGYEAIHKLYPFSVLGHRISHNLPERPNVALWNFGWQSVWALFSRGLFGQLLNQNYDGKVTGLWAIEPHLGTQGFGAKFEEILVIDEKSATWLEGPFGVS